MADVGLAPIRLVALDLDGTLCRNDGTVSTRTKEALQAVRRAGVKVSFATGRPSFMAKSVKDLADREVDYIICMNGAEVFSKEWESMHEMSMTDHDAELIVDALISAEMPCCIFLGHQGVTADDPVEIILTESYRTYVQNGPLSRGMNATTYELMQRKLCLLDDITQWKASVNGNRKVIALGVVAPNRNKDLVVDAVSHVKASAPLVVTDTGYGPYEIKLATAGQKDVALDAMRQTLGLTRAQTMAFGDGANDISMLTWAACGVAMGNASEEVKAAANKTTLSNEEDGVAIELEALCRAIASTTRSEDTAIMVASTAESSMSESGPKMSSSEILARVVASLALAMLVPLVVYLMFKQ